MSEPSIVTDPPVRERSEPPIPAVAYRVINPMMAALLRSPLHGLVSDSLLLITFEGRVSGDRYTTPVGYWESDGRLHVFNHSGWWRNLVNGMRVTVRLRGETHQGEATAHPDPDQVARRVREFIDANGLAAARRLGFTFPAGRVPDEETIAAAVEDTVVIEIDLEDQ